MKFDQILVFSELYKDISKTPMSFKLAYKFQKTADLLSKEIEFYQTNFRTLIQQYGMLDDEGKLIQAEDGSIRLIPETAEEGAKKIQELNECEIDFEPIIPIEDLEELKLTIEQMRILMPFIKE